MTRPLWGLYVLLLGLVLGRSVLDWYSAGSLPPAQALQPPPLPSEPPTLGDQPRQTILAHNLWDERRGQVLAPDAEAFAETGAKPAAAQVWHLRAVIAPAPSGPLAMIENSTARDEKWHTYREGDELPNGERLLEILPDGIVFQESDQTQQRFLFGKEPMVGASL